jgi:fused signal recognition particle receptor
MIWGLFNKRNPAEQQTESKGLFDGLRKSSSKLADSIGAVFTKEKLDAAGLAELEDALVTSDMGAPSAARIAAALADQRFSKENGATEAREALAAEVARILKPREATLDLSAGPKPRIVLVIGVNGSGKTTTIGKLSKLLADADAKVVIGAADTFRAAAIEQLQVWAQRTGASFVSSHQGADATKRCSYSTPPSARTLSVKSRASAPSPTSPVS